MDFKELRDKVVFDHEGSVANAKWLYDILEKAREPTREIMVTHFTLDEAVSEFPFISWGGYWAGDSREYGKSVVKISTLRKEIENNAA